MTVNEKGYAKLNYSLDVHARRPDGYHDLTMVMGSVSLWDDVDVTLRRDGRIEAKCSIPWLPRDERNLAVRAARVFFDAAGDKTLGADIRIKKRVPVGAGMAGGSTDAAAVLRALTVQLLSFGARKMAPAVFLRVGHYAFTACSFFT